MLLDKNRPEKRISSSLYIKIRNFFDYIHFNDHSYLINESDFLMQLPPRIKQELLDHLFRDEIKQFKAFFKGCPDHFSF
jgi:hypothetical protein